jgi:hypothetical protein
LNQPFGERGWTSRSSFVDAWDGSSSSATERVLNRALAPSPLCAAKKAEGVRTFEDSRRVRSRAPGSRRCRQHMRAEAPFLQLRVESTGIREAGPRAIPFNKTWENSGVGAPKVRESEWSTTLRAARVHRPYSPPGLPTVRKTEA